MTPFVILVLIESKKIVLLDFSFITKKKGKTKRCFMILRFFTLCQKFDVSSPAKIIFAEIRSAVILLLSKPKNLFSGKNNFQIFYMSGRRTTNTWETANLPAVIHTEHWQIIPLDWCNWCRLLSDFAFFLSLGKKTKTNEKLGESALSV